MSEQKSVSKVLPILREMVEDGLWDTEKEAVEEFKLLKERKLKPMGGDKRKK